MRGEEFERTFEIAFEAADRVHARLPRTSGAVIGIGCGRRPAHPERPPVIDGGPTPSDHDWLLRYRLVKQHSSVVGRGEMLQWKPRAIDFLHEYRSRHNPIVFKRKGRDRRPMPREPQEIVKARACGRHSVPLCGPSKLAQ